MGKKVSEIEAYRLLFWRTHRRICIGLLTGKRTELEGSGGLGLK